MLWHPARTLPILLALALVPALAVADPPWLVRRQAADGTVATDTLAPGSGLVQVVVDGRVVASRAVDPAAPLRLIVELDAEPAATARLRAQDPTRPQRVLQRFRADLATLGSAATVTREFTQVFSGAAVTVPRSLLERVRALPGVRAVFPDDTVRATLAESVPLIGANRVRNNLGASGAGIRIGIVDTGIDYTHPAFGGGYGPGHRVAGGWDAVNQDDDPMDDNGHGTHVAGIAAGNGGGVVGVAPDATLYAFKVLNASGVGLQSDILAALDRVLDPDQNPATDDAMQVINLSLGGGGNADDPMSRALDRLSEAGVVCAVAAGNLGSWFGITSPGTSRLAVTVGATTKADQLAWFSSLGPAPVTLDLKPDLVAPGVGIVSAARGGGTVALSGTSMAAPHVAGVAAQIRGLHPDWSVDVVRSVLAGRSVNLGMAAWRQGAGRLDAWAAATAGFAIVPTRLAFGRIDPDGVWTSSATLRVSNLGTATRLVTFPATVEVAPGATLQVSPASAFVQAGSSAPFVVSLEVDNAEVAYPKNRPYGWDTTLVATSGLEHHAVPVSFHKAASLRVHSIADFDIAIVHDRTRGGFHDYFQPATGDPPMLLPPGNYDVMASFFLFQSGGWVLKENVPVSGDTELDVGPEQATTRYDFSNVDRQGLPVACNMGSISLFHAPSGTSLNYVGFPFSHLSVSPASAAYGLDWVRTSFNWRDRRISFSGTFQGPFTGSREVTNRPADLRHLVLHFPALPVPSAAPLFFELMPFRADSSYFGLAGFDTTIAPIRGPFDFDWWLTPPPYEGHFQLGAFLELYRWDHGFLRFGDIALISPSLRLDRGWPIEGYLSTFYGPRAFLFGGERLSLGGGVPVWRGMFNNRPDALQLWAGDDETTSHLLTDMYGTLALGDDPPFLLIPEGGGAGVTDTLRGTGSLHGPPFVRPIDPGRWTFRTSHAYEVRGRPAILDVAARFDTRLYDGSPPSLREFQIVQDGEVTDSIAFAAAREVTISFRVVDTYATVELEVRPPGGAWTPLVPVADGAGWRAPLPPTLDGPVDLILRARDPLSNELEMTWAPAFVAAAIAAEAIVSLGATVAGGVIQLSWRAPGLAGRAAPVERREATTPWREIGVASVGNDGNAAFTDRSALGNHTYGYRLTAPNAGAPVHSDEVWIEVPEAPAFALGGLRPNPATGGDLMVEFQLPDAAPATLDLYDITGRRIVSRDVGALGPGRHLIPLAPTPPRVGVYILRLSRASQSLTRRISILR